MHRTGHNFTRLNKLVAHRLVESTGFRDRVVESLGRAAFSIPVYSSVTHFSETSRFPVLSLCLLLVPYHPRCGPRSYSKFRAFRPRRGLQSGQQRRARTRRPTTSSSTMARQKQSSTSSRPRKRSRGSTASPSSSNGNNLNNGMHCACVFHVAYSTCARREGEQKQETI